MAQTETSTKTVITIGKPCEVIKSLTVLTPTKNLDVLSVLRNVISHHELHHERVSINIVDNHLLHPLVLVIANIITTRLYIAAQVMLISVPNNPDETVKITHAVLTINLVHVFVSFLVDKGIITLI
jgi:hypothetical protein